MRQDLVHSPPLPIPLSQGCSEHITGTQKPVKRMAKGEFHRKKKAEHRTRQGKESCMTKGGHSRI